MRQSIGRIGITRLAAFFAMLVLVLQSALAVAAPPVQRDIFGNVICADGSSGQAPDRGHDSGHMPDCCILSCGTVLQAASTLPDAIELPIVTFDIGETVSYPSHGFISRRDRRTPANPRAPPAA